MLKWLIAHIFNLSAPNGILSLRMLPNKEGSLIQIIRSQEGPTREDKYFSLHFYTLAHDVLAVCRA